MIRSNLVLEIEFGDHWLTCTGRDSLWRRDAEELQGDYPCYRASNSNWFHKRLSHRHYQIFANNAQMVDWNALGEEAVCFLRTTRLWVHFSIHTLFTHATYFHWALKRHCNSLNPPRRYFSWEGFDHILWEHPSIRGSVIYVKLWELMRSRLYANADFSHKGRESAKQ